MATTIRDAEAAFDNAIAVGVLSDDENSPVYAGLFMYMHSDDNLDHFKNIDTRRYITATK